MSQDWSFHEVEIPNIFNGRVVRAFSVIHERSIEQAVKRASHEGFTGDLIIEYDDGRRVSVSPTGYEVDGLEISTETAVERAKNRPHLRDMPIRTETCWCGAAPNEPHNV